MFIKHRKFIQNFLVLVGIFTIAILAGGNYLHGYIHNHNDVTSLEQCPFYHLLSQALFLLLCSLIFIELSKQRQFFILKESFQTQIFECLPNLRAPPVIK